MAAPQAPAADPWWQAMSGTILRGQAVTNNDFRPLLEALAVTSSGQENAAAAAAVAGFQASEALHMLALGEGEVCQQPFMVEKVALTKYSSSNRQQRGILVAAADAEQVGSKGSRQKRQRTEEGEAAEGGGEGGGEGEAKASYPDTGSGGATTYVPYERGQLPVLMVRLGSRHRYPADRKDSYYQLKQQHKAAPARSEARKALALQMRAPASHKVRFCHARMLPSLARLGLLLTCALPVQWGVTEAARVVPLPAAQQQRLQIVNVTQEGSGEGALTWLHLAAAPAGFRADRTLVQIAGVGTAVDGYRVVNKAEGARVAVKGLKTESRAAPPGAELRSDEWAMLPHMHICATFPPDNVSCLQLLELDRWICRVLHGPEQTLVVYHIRLLEDRTAAAPAAAPAAAAAQQQQQVQGAAATCAPRAGCAHGASRAAAGRSGHAAGPGRHAAGPTDGPGPAAGRRHRDGVRSSDRYRSGRSSMFFNTPTQAVELHYSCIDSNA